jgi:uncharacterized protein YbjT (DUF2867 family)
MDAALEGRDAWLGFNVSASEVPAAAALAIKHGIKRLVLGVYLSPDERGADNVFADTQAQLAAAGVAFTIVKFAEVKKMGEAKFPYRIMRGELPLPGATEVSSAVSSEDLMRVLCECVDLPKAFGQVYGVGPGSRLDSEILIYMKSQGWPERKCSF